MELKRAAEGMAKQVKKYRYAVMVILLGILLMAVPIKKDSQTVPAPAQEEGTYQKSVEERLCEILSQIDGAGKVSVMLTAAVGEEVIFQTDERLSGDDVSRTQQHDTVILTNTERSQAGLVRQVNPPVFLGAVVVCQGADRASVCLNIVEAVAKTTGLSTDRISVLKMK